MTCLKYLVPMSCALFLGAVVWPLVMVWVTPDNRSTWKWWTPLGSKVSAARQIEDEAEPVVVETVSYEGSGGSASTDRQEVRR